MQLEWFRRHKSFVYYLLLPVVVLGMGMFGATSAISSWRSSRGPAIQYRRKLGGSLHYLGPAEVMALRYVLTQYSRQTYSTDGAALHEVAWNVAAQNGFELGEQETRDHLIAEIQNRTEQQNATDNLYRKLLSSLQLTAAQFEDVTRETNLYGKLLRYLHETCKVDDQELFVAYSEEKEVVRLRFKEFKTEELLDKGQEPSQDAVRKCYNEYVDLWTLIERIQNGKGTRETVERAKRARDTFRHTYKTNIGEFTDLLIAKPRISADMVFLDQEKLAAGDNKPEDSTLKQLYEQNKNDWKIVPKAGEPAPQPGEEKYKPFDEVKAEVEAKWKEQELKTFYQAHKVDWKIPAKPGEPPPKAGEEKYKTFEEVKAEVETKWKEKGLRDWYEVHKADWKIPLKPGEPPPKPGEEKYKPFEEVKAEVAKKYIPDRAMRRMDRLQREEADAEVAYEREQEARPEPQRKPWDMADWAKKQDLVYWVTDELSEAQYKAGKKVIKAPDAGWGEALFSLYKDPMDFSRITGQGAQKFIEDQRKRQIENRKKFFTPQFTDPGAKEQGVVMAKKKKYLPEEPKTFDAVSAALAKRLRAWDAVEKVRAEWAEGKVPPLDSLDEVRGDRESNKVAKQPLVQVFLSSPKPVGEVLDVAVAPPDENAPPDPAASQRFYVGFAVDRELPNWDAFQHDMEWQRKPQREELEQSHAASRNQALRRQLDDMGKKIGDMDDPPLFESYRRGGPVPDDD